MTDERYYIPKQGTLYVPCLTPGCNNTPKNIEVRMAHALLEYNLKKNPAATFSVECERCHQLSRFSHDKIIDMLDPAILHQNLPNEQLWAIILMELETADELEYRGFFGERVLVQITILQDDSWAGKILGQSQFAPSVNIGSQVGGGVFSDYYVCNSLSSSNEWVDLPFEGVPENSVFSLFFLPKQNDNFDLKCANLFCSNPSCNNSFSYTYSEVRNKIEQDQTTYFVACCERCGVCRVIDLESFEGLFKV